MLRLYVFASVFFSGASLMSLEMAGFRLVQPEFGSDIVVWGSLISVILGGLSLGAYTGGKMADRIPSMFSLGAIMMACGLVVALMPIYSDAVLTGLTGSRGFQLAVAPGPGPAAAAAVHRPPDVRLTVLSAGLVLFFVPALLMGMVSPYSAKLLIRQMPSIGRGVGMISAISTLGSITGTLGTTFYLMQILGTRAIILMNGFLLLALGAGAMAFQFLAPRESRRAAAAR